MITILHGDDTAQSRDEFQKLVAKAKRPDIRHINGKSTDMTQLATAFGSTSIMVGTSPLVTIENLFGPVLKKVTKLDSFVGALKSVPKDTDVIIWEGKELPKSLVSKLASTSTIRLFSIPVVLFQFLDAIAPSKPKILLELYQKLKATHPDELIAYMLSRRIRLLLIVSDGGTPEGMAPWQRQRLTTQARLFTMEKLCFMYRKLLTMEYSLKTGQTPFTLSELLEQFLLEI